MEHISNRHSVNQTHTHYMTYTDKIKNSTEQKYQKSRGVVSAIMFPNTDPYIALTNWKCTCCFCQNFPPCI